MLTGKPSASLPFLFLFLLSFLPALPAGEIAVEDVELLSKLQRDHMEYFVRLSDKVSGLTRDSSRTGSPASIAATGFALASVSIGEANGWIPRKEAYGQLRKTLTFLLMKADHKKGFFYHFLDPRTGRRIWTSEASSIDTALLLAGALLAGEYHPGTDIEAMADELYRRVDWKWMMNRSDFICMGWKPESGFLPYYWDSYNELMILYALAIGAPSKSRAVPPQAWDRWMRPAESYAGKAIVHSSTGSLFTYQYSHAFIDFRNLDDSGVNYFENSRLATVANREYSQSFQGQYQSYSEASWGLSASVGPGGYKAYGAKPGQGLHDGTIAPYAALSSIVFTPRESTAAARFFYENYAKDLYGLFGFKDAFNLDKRWWAQEYLGIDQGIVVVMLQNYLRNGEVWDLFMKLPAMRSWIELCKLASGEAKSGAGTIPAS